MKLSIIALSLLSTLAPLVDATPSPNQAAYLGWATLNGGTKGGIGGPTVTVSSLAALKSALSDDTSRIVMLAAGSYTGNEVIKIGANKSLIGISPGPSLVGIGLRVLEKSNIIIRNLKISKVLAEAGDAIGIQGTTVKNIWIDQCDLSSDMDHDKDYYDGLLDITHGVQFVSITYTKFHDQWKGSLVGHSDSNGSEDTVFTVTYAYNYWYNINSRMPSFRFGTGKKQFLIFTKQLIYFLALEGHILNSYFLDSGDAINARGSRLRVENNVFSNVKAPISGDGCVDAVNNLGATPNTALPCNPPVLIPYSYTTLSLSLVPSYVPANAGTH
ncbi:hypothetical protein FRC03_012080 [Tulasnella sp. 419]|nr:hypothetical protein FRC03_012080 [Tulasnella sp. 419]